MEQRPPPIITSTRTYMGRCQTQEHLCKQRIHFSAGCLRVTPCEEGYRDVPCGRNFDCNETPCDWPCQIPEDNRAWKEKALWLSLVQYLEQNVSVQVKIRKIGASTLWELNDFDQLSTKNSKAEVSIGATVTLGVSYLRRLDVPTSATAFLGSLCTLMSVLEHFIPSWPK